MMSKKIIGTIVTSAALAAAATSTAYAIWQKKHTDEKILEAKADTIWRLRRVGSQNSFPHPTKETLEKLTGNGCKSIAFQIGNNSYSDDDFGNLARECAVCILKELSESMRENETLAEYFLRKEIEFPL